MGDVDQPQGAGLDQHPRRLGALGAGERERAGAQLGAQLAVQVALAVGQPPGEPRDPLAVDDPVGDQPHRAGRQIAAAVPIGEPGAAWGWQRRQARKPALWAAAAVG